MDGKFPIGNKTDFSHFRKLEQDCEKLANTVKALSSKVDIIMLHIKTTMESYFAELSISDSKLEMPDLPLDFDVDDFERPTSTSMQLSCDGDDDEEDEGLAPLPFLDDEDILQGSKFETERDFDIDMLMADESIYESSTDSE